MSEELKPCPYCGKKAESFITNTGCYREGTFFVSFKVGCEPCGIYFSARTEFDVNADGTIKILKDGYKIAAEKWNRRIK